MNCLTGNVFLNDFVLEKRAGNSGLDYINHTIPYSVHNGVVLVAGVL